MPISLANPALKPRLNVSVDVLLANTIITFFVSTGDTLVTRSLKATSTPVDVTRKLDPI